MRLVCESMIKSSYYVYFSLHSVFFLFTDYVLKYTKLKNHILTHKLQNFFFFNSPDPAI